jgi:hypothetical protein
MRATAAALALAFVATSASAAPRRTIRRSEDLRLVFLAGDAAPVHQGATGDALIDVGRVTGRCARGCPRPVIQRRFRLRIDGGGSARFVRVRAFLQVATPGQQVRLDGRLLTEAPLIVDAATPLGVAVAHTVEIEVSPSAREGVLAESIVWIAEELQ